MPQLKYKQYSTLITNAMNNIFMQKQKPEANGKVFDKEKY
jgi:hypothetical protein